MAPTADQRNLRKTVRQPLLAVLAEVVVALVAAPASAPHPALADRVARGRYLTERVAMCIQCHDAEGVSDYLASLPEFGGGQ